MPDWLKVLDQARLEPEVWFIPTCWATATTT